MKKDVRTLSLNVGKWEVLLVDVSSWFTLLLFSQICLEVFQLSRFWLWSKFALRIIDVFRLSAVVPGRSTSFSAHVQLCTVSLDHIAVKSGSAASS